MGETLNTNVTAQCNGDIWLGTLHKILNIYDFFLIYTNCIQYNFACILGATQGSEARSVTKSEKTWSFLAKRRTEWAHDGPLEIVGWFGGREERSVGSERQHWQQNVWV